MNGIIIILTYRGVLFGNCSQFRWEHISRVQNDAPKANWEFLISDDDSAAVLKGVGILEQRDSEVS